jgi:murein DD-endopeptidase MepM/ murein hydrolase activator NlpD
MYNSGLGRFLSVDPLTKKYPELTPYQFASNTPIQATDLDGLESWSFHNRKAKDERGKLILGPISDMYRISRNLDTKDALKLRIDDQIMKSPLANPYITSPLSPNRVNPVTGIIKHHDGVDLVDLNGNTLGKPVTAPLDGTVESVKPFTDGNAAGNRVHFRDESLNKHSFFHLKDFNVKPGQVLEQGDVIGAAGNTGVGTAPHLHYELRDRSGKLLDPVKVNPGLFGAKQKNQKQ